MVAKINLHCFFRQRRFIYTFARHLGSENRETNVGLSTRLRENSRRFIYTFVRHFGSHRLVLCAIKINKKARAWAWGLEVGSMSSVLADNRCPRSQISWGSRIWPHIGFSWEKQEKTPKMPRLDREAWKWAQWAPFELIIGVLGAKSLGEAEFGLRLVFCWKNRK